MAYLNAQERENLQKELQGLDFVKAKRKLFLVDQKGRLAFYRNAQHSDQLETRFDLEGLGTRVTIIEKHTRELDKSGKVYNSKFEIVNVVVEPLAGNRL